MSKIFITGGSGFIGSHLAEKLNNLGHDVTIYDINEPLAKNIRFIKGDIRNESLLEKSIAGHATVCHLAAMLGVTACLKDKDSVYSTNLQGTKNVINACEKNEVSNLLFSSSSEVYGEGDANSKLFEDMDLKPKSHYGISKMLGEAEMKAFSERTQTKVTVLRYCNIYGPRQRKDFVIPIFMRSVLSGTPLTVCGDGGQIRSFTYIDDAVTGTIQALFRVNNFFDIYNIGTSEPITIKELAQKTIGLHGSGRIDLLPFEKLEREKECEVLIRIPSVDKASSAIGYCPSIKLDTGLSTTYNYLVTSISFAH